MRPGQNKRMRGRNNSNNRKGPNPLTRSYESNGPDVKIRGTAHHIGEKYLQLARDAQSSGDPVMAESYLQHAEHYFRLIAAAQQAQFGYQRQPGDIQENDDEDGDEDFAAVPDRFASPGERQPHTPQNILQPHMDRQPFSDRQQPYDGRQDQGRQDRHQDHRQQDHRQPPFDRQGIDRQGNDRQGNDRQGNDRQGNDRQPYESRDRQYDNRRNTFQDRNGQGGHDRQDRGNQDRGNQERGGQERNAQERNGQDRNGQDRQPRDYDNRGPRNRNRDFRDPAREGREPPQSSADEPANGLPAFITSPTRVQPESEPQPETNQPPVEASEDASQHMRPRRRRRPRPEFADGHEDDGRQDDRQEASANDPVGD